MRERARAHDDDRGTRFATKSATLPRSQAAQGFHSAEV